MAFFFFLCVCVIVMMMGTDEGVGGTGRVL